MVRVLLATKNAHKAGELAALLAPLAGAVGLAQWEAEMGRALPEPAEDGDTFEANALIKARAYARASGLATLADDSGLSVEALGGAPGVRSARFGGPGLTDGQRAALLLKEMAGQADRRAHFTCVLALARPDGQALTWAGRAEGLILAEARGENGFGYDPVFFYPPAGLTFAQMTAAAKGEVSHRAAAARLFKEWLNSADLGEIRHFLKDAANARQ